MKRKANSEQLSLFDLLGSTNESTSSVVTPKSNNTSLFDLLDETSHKDSSQATDEFDQVELTQEKGEINVNNLLHQTGSDLLGDVPSRGTVEPRESAELLRGAHRGDLPRSVQPNGPDSVEDNQGGNRLYDTTGADQYGAVTGGGRGIFRDDLSSPRAGNRGSDNADGGGVSRGGNNLVSSSSFRPNSQDDLAPAGKKAKLKANLAALELLEELTNTGASPSADELGVLARYSSFGALPELFAEDRGEFEDERARIYELLGEQGLEAARATTLNAHFTAYMLVSEIWEAIRQLGFSSGTVLEPGCGIGTFFFDAPQGSNLIGVELDPTTAKIACLLHPNATILNESFGDSNITDNSVDLVVGNVPFGAYKLFDSRHNRPNHSIHNHFVIKSLHLLKPGGIMVVLTSRYSLDARNPAARREMFAQADLLGAIRLPSNAHSASAGTQVVSDILVFRKHDNIESIGHPFVSTCEIEAAGGQMIRVNEYFANHLDHILGEIEVRHGMYGNNDLAVEGDLENLKELLHNALKTIVSEALSKGGAISQVPASVTTLPTNQPQLPQGRGFIEGSLCLVDGQFYQVTSGLLEPYAPKAGEREELRSLIELRDIYLQVLELQASTTTSDDELAQAQALLNERYDSYLSSYGPLNRFKLARTGRTDKETGEELFRRINPSLGGFSKDPWYRTLRALEDFDEETQTPTKTPIFSRRVIDPSVSLNGADTAEDALAICLNEQGRVSLDRIAQLLGVSYSEARTELGTLVFDCPDTDELLTAEDYLSGPVVERLARAKAAARLDERYEVNVSHLLGVQPKRLEAQEISVRLGASWIEVRDIEEFCWQVLRARPTIEHCGANLWKVKVSLYNRESVLASTEYGIPGADAFHLLECCLTQRPVRVYRDLGDGKRALDMEATLVAQERAQHLQDSFAKWLMSDEERSTRVVDTYNRLFNSQVLRHYDGSHLRLPGLSSTFRPHSYQKDVVWRIICDESVLLAHPVGAGKTAEMVMGARELRRLGLVKLPCFVVPNHMLDQFSREYCQLYPGARILSADKDDVSPGQRRAFAAKCATGDFEAIIMTHSSFSRLPIDPNIEVSYLKEEVESITDAISRSKEGSGLLVKTLELTRKRAQERIERQMARIDADEGICFEQTGIDYICLDEAHLFKNLRVDSRLPGLSVEGSLRAQKLDMMLYSLRQRNPKRLCSFATGTPVANSLGEAHTMMRYLIPEVLSNAGVDSFDSWAATFARLCSEIEMSPEGGSFRMVERISRFENVPELIRMFRQVADVLAPGTLDSARPTLEGGRAQIITIAPDEHLRAYMDSLVGRAQQVRNRVVEPTQDNMLKISSDGRKAALDMRLVGGPGSPNGKLAQAATIIAKIYHETRDTLYYSSSGQEHPRRGSFQLVFCDLSTPKPPFWSCYEELASLLVKRGLPRDEIRFIHQANSDKAKAQLFEACRDGRVAVLIGSTEKMGVGTNVQTRAIALHHLDCPWRPADVEQREGRILRQGNQNSQVVIYRYATEGSFDVYMWQTVERKAQFIAQIMSSQSTDREVDDIGEQTLSYAEVKALASGNPLVIEQAEVDAQVNKLIRLERAHNADLARRSRFIVDGGERLEKLDAKLSLVDQALAKRVDVAGDKFQMRVENVDFHKRPDAGQKLLEIIESLAQRSDFSVRDGITIGELAGFEVIARRTPSTSNSHSVVLSLRDVPTGVVQVDLDNSTERPDGLGLVRKLTNLSIALDSTRKDVLNTKTELQGQIDDARKHVTQSFPKQDELARVQARKREIAELLRVEAAKDEVVVADPPSQVSVEL